jgi:hypothetical protein
MNILIEQYRLFNDNDLFIDFVTNHKIMVYDQITNPQDLLNCSEIHYSDLTFNYDLNNYRLPYYQNKFITAIKIDLNDVYNYISSNSLLPDNQIICGENIQYLADVVIGSKKSLLFNPNNRYYSKELQIIDELNDISKYKKIFVFTHDLELFYNKFGNKLSDKIILSHNSDHGIEHIKDVKMHLAQNCLIKSPSLVPLPIGIENRQWFDHKIFHKIRKMKIPKSNYMYYFFNLNTHPSRVRCKNILDENLIWNIARSKEDYYIELASHKYAICPRGNGLDTHRIWECLYLDVIPIIIKSDDLTIDNLPIIILEDWNKLFLKNSFIKQENSKITMGYYNKKLG